MGIDELTTMLATWVPLVLGLLASVALVLGLIVLSARLFSATVAHLLPARVVSLAESASALATTVQSETAAGLLELRNELEAHKREMEGLLDELEHEFGRLERKRNQVQGVVSRLERKEQQQQEQPQLGLEPGVAQLDAYRQQFGVGRY